MADDLEALVTVGPPAAPAAALAGLRHRAGGLLPGAAARRAQVPAHARWWAERNRAALVEAGPLWVVLGDSTAQAIGADDPGTGYVGQVLDRLRSPDGDGRPWRAINLSRTGDTAADVVAHQLPRLAALRAAGVEPSLVSCAVGANDLLRRSRTTEADLAAIAAALAPGALLSELPRGLREARAIGLNAVLLRLSERHGHHLVPLWRTTGAPWKGKYSADGFHPNAVGYADWARAFTTVLDGLRS